MVLLLNVSDFVLDKQQDFLDALILYKSPHTQTLNSPRKVNRLDCWFYFIIINQFIYFSIQHRIYHSCIRK